MSERNGDGSYEMEATVTVHVVIREDQNEYGFVDTSVVGLFRSQKEAKLFVKSSISTARDEGLLVCGTPGFDDDWEVCWMIESHPLA